MASHLSTAIVFGLSLCISAPLQALAQDGSMPAESALVEHMHEKLTRISMIKAFIIMGDLESTREPARWLATQEETAASVPIDYEPFVVFMQSIARQVAAAETLQDASFAVSLMAQNCGSCHVASDLKIEFGFDEAPPQWSDNQTHMQRYLWASDRMWEGLMGPSDNAWDRGLGLLASNDPIAAASISDEFTVDNEAEIDAIAASVHDLAEAGLDAHDSTERSRILGRILGQCAACHERTGGGPGRVGR